MAKIIYDFGEALGDKLAPAPGAEVSIGEQVQRARILLAEQRGRLEERERWQLRMGAWLLGWLVFVMAAFILGILSERFRWL